MRRLICVSLALVALATSAVPAALAAGPEGRYIVLLSDEAATQGVMRAEDFSVSRVDRAKVGDRVRELRDGRGIRPDRVFRAAVPGFSAHLTPAEVEALRADPAVEAVVPDLPVTLREGRRTNGAAAIVTTTLDSGPVVPTGIRRIRAVDSPIARIDGTDQRVNANVAVLDTGINGHRDLNVEGGVNCTEQGGRNAWADPHGHGTHVAGTIGALDNGRGVVGVAPGVDLWSVRVLDGDAKGWTSWIICGLDFVARKKKADGSRFFDAVNVSISGPLDARGTCEDTRSPYQAATCRVVAMGIPVVVAAGNDSRDASRYRPGAYENVITVSALADFDGRPGGEGSQADTCPFYSADQDDTFADFSNYGPDVDIIAPGKCILSTYTGGRYAWMSGTSMATPHVTGAVALYHVQYPDAGPLQTKQALQAAGTLEWRTGTDPDGQPEPLLRVAAPGPPPTFDISIDEPVPWLGLDKRLLVPVGGGRRDGHREPITLSSSDLPRGVTALRSVIRDRAGELRLQSDDRVESGEHSVRVRATDGELRSAATFTLRIDAQPPKAGFDTPARGNLRLTESSEQALAWSESDTGGSGLAGRTVQHQTGAVVTPGTCEGVTWADAGGPITGPSPATDRDLAAGLCHRWRLRAQDDARNATVTISGASIRDTAPPPAPTFGTDGQRSWLETPAGPLWFGSAQAGDVALSVRSIDPHAGTRELRTSALDPAAGWDGPPARTSDGERTVLTLSWARGAPATSLRARAVDRLDHESAWRTLELRPDASDPVSADWVSPAPGAPGFSRGSVTLEYAGGSDTGSGIDPVASVARRAGAVVSEGTCDGVTFAADGPDVERPSGSTVSGLESATCYRWSLTSRDRVGNAGDPRTSGTVLVDAIAPRVTFSAPEPGPIAFDDDGRVDVTFGIEERGGSGRASASVRRQVGAVAEPGTCTGVDWTDDGAAAAVTRATTTLQETGLRSGSCYRWQVRVSDRAGNERVERSTPVLVDMAAPPSAQVSVAEGPAWTEGPDGPVWFRAGVSGSFVLRSMPRQDPDSGIAGTRFGGVSPGAGWSDAATEPAFAGGRPADRRYGHGSGAGDASVRLVSRDRAGNEGPALEVALRADPDAPVVTITHPEAGTTILPDDRVTITWDDRDPGAGIAARTLVRERARRGDRPDCAGVDWSRDGRSFAATSGVVVTDLKAGWCYRWRLSVRDRVGNVRRVTTGAVRLEGGIALDVDAVRIRLAAEQVGRSGAVPGRLAWELDAARTANGVRHDVAATTDGGDTWSWLARGMRGQRLDVRLDPRRSVVFAVRARSADGEQSTWEESGRVRALLVQEANASVEWSGSWSRVRAASASGGTLRRSSSAGATARLRFEGSSVALVTEVGPRAGGLTLRLDGSVVGRPSLRRADASSRRMLVVAAGLGPGEHTLELVVGGDGRVAVDAFIVLRVAPTSVAR